MSEKRFTWKTEKLQHLDDEVLVVVDNENKEWKGHILNIVDLLNSLAEENKILIRQKNILDRALCVRECEYEKLTEENERLRQMIKENVFGKYEEGSLADLEFKAIAYDDIVRLEISNELEPKVIVTCKRGGKENVRSFCRMFIPYGVYYEIKELEDI